MGSKADVRDRMALLLSKQHRKIINKTQQINIGSLLNSKSVIEDDPRKSRNSFLLGANTLPSDDFSEVVLNPEQLDPTQACKPAILEDMQPLYFFNVKLERPQSSETSDQAPRLPRGAKEAATPFFLGSP